MNELKPEDVMEEAECCGYATGCTDCVLAKYDGSPCIVKKALALLREKDAEIERLTAENGILKKRLDEAETNIELLEDAVGDVSDDEVEQLEKLLAMERAEAITEFAERVKKFYANLKGKTVGGSVEYHIDQIAKDMKEDLS